jgi:hypothetical protein
MQSGAAKFVISNGKCDRELLKNAVMNERGNAKMIRNKNLLNEIFCKLLTMEIVDREIINVRLEKTNFCRLSISIKVIK